ASIASYRRAVALDPALAFAWLNLGVALEQAGRHAEAVEAFQQAVALTPDDAAAHANLSIALRSLNRLDAALTGYRRALQCDARRVRLRLNEGLAHLLKGDFPPGWTGYEWRFEAGVPRSPHEATHPRWTGQQALSGRTILLHAEQ